MGYQNDKYSGIYVFEGIDNVGKTTIINRLKEKIREGTDYECVMITFPGNEPRTLGNLVYDIHHNEDKYLNETLNEASLQMLHVASHIDLIHRKLRKLCNNRCIVLLDRYWWSTYAYGLANGLNADIVQAIIEPELIFWEKIRVNKIFLIERQNRERDYKEAKENKIVSAYHELVSKEPKSIIIDNNSDVESTVTKIYNCIVEV